MGLTCSLLGHEFDETEAERDREERGDEVVVTVREYATCDRCGKRKLLGENKEVTTLADEEPDDEPASGAGVEPDPGPTAGSASTPPEATEPTGTPADDAPVDGDDAEIIDGDEPTDDPAEVVDADDGGDEPDEADPAEIIEDAVGDGADAPEPASDAEADAEPADDDGVIMDETDGDRDPGEWPPVEDGEEPADGDAEWPETGGEDEGYDAEPSEGGPSGVEFGGSLSPEATGEEETTGAPAEEVGAESGIASAGTAPAPDDARSDESVPFVCPACDFVADSGRASLRAGDICPECRRGYLTEKPR